MTKKIKIILLIIAIFILAGGLVCYLSWDSERIITVTPTTSRLDDAGLVYASKFWGGLCSNGKGEEGGCYFEAYLYDTGRTVNESGFVHGDNKIDANSTIEKNLGTSLVNQIIKKIKDSGLMVKDCPSSLIMDANWYYQVTIDGVKKEFRDVLKDCKDTFEEIDKMLDDAIKNN